MVGFPSRVAHCQLDFFTEIEIQFTIKIPFMLLFIIICIDNVIVASDLLITSRYKHGSCPGACHLPHAPTAPESRYQAPAPAVWLASVCSPHHQVSELDTSRHRSYGPGLVLELQTNLRENYAKFCNHRKGLY